MNDGPEEKPQAYARKDLRTPLITLKVKVEDDRKVFFGYAKNISRGGIFIASSNPKEPGSRFEVEIPLPAPLDLSVRCSCEVVWQRQYSKKAHHEPGMGLKFIDMPEDVAEAIDEWVRDQLQAEEQ